MLLTSLPAACRFSHKGRKYHECQSDFRSYCFETSAYAHDHLASSAHPLPLDLLVFLCLLHRDALCRNDLMKGLSDCNKYFATPSPAAPTPFPTPAPTPGEVVGGPPPTSSTSTYGSTSTRTFYDDDAFYSGTTPSPAAAATAPPTPSPVVRPAIRFNVETTAHEWCPRVPLSECAVDYEGVESGSVRSLHASFYVSYFALLQVGVADPVMHIMHLCGRRFGSASIRSCFCRSCLAHVCFVVLPVWR